MSFLDIGLEKEHILALSVHIRRKLRSHESRKGENVQICFCFSQNLAMERKEGVIDYLRE